MPYIITRRRAVRTLLFLPVIPVLESGRALAQRGMNRARVGAILNEAENRSDVFRKTLDSALDASRLNKSNREDDLNRSAKRLENEIDQAQKEFRKAKDWQDIRSNVNKAMDAGRNINLTMRNRRMGGPAERQWTALRQSLNQLGVAYSVPPIR